MKKVTSLKCILGALTLVLTIGSCKKADITTSAANIVTDPAFNDARRYFENNIQHSNSGSLQTQSSNNSLSPQKTPVWDKAYLTTLSSGPAVVIPLKYTQRSIFKSNLDSIHLFDMDVASKLVIYKDHSGQFHTEVLNMYPDSSLSKNSKYSGIIKVLDWEGNLINEYKYEGSKIKKLKPGASTGKVSTNSVNPSQPVSINMLMIIQTDYYLVTYTYVVSDPNGGVYNYEYLGSSYSFIDDGGGGGDSGGGSLDGSDYSNIGSGGPGGSAISPSTEFTVETGNDPIANVQDYIKCFNGNLSASYTISLCVAQPMIGERNTYTSGMNGVNVGHTFLIFQQNESGVVTTRSMGFYPNGIVSPGQPRAAGSLNNDQGHIYNVSLTFTTTGQQFMSILNSFSSGMLTNYDLNTNNCTTWALSSLSAGGINISTTPGTWPFGGGDDPGDLGEDIRNMNLGANMVRTLNNNSASQNAGTCP